jgi:hypothetical protein
VAILAWALVALGSVLRLCRWLHWRSLWLDEIYLANSLITRSWHDLLFKPLEDWQAAPPGFLALVHLTIGVFGTSERSLRLVSLLFGLASLPLALAVARRILSPGAALVATAMFVFLGPAIYYSNELKPYSCDAACSLAMTLAVLRLVERPTSDRAAAALAIGAVSIFLSYPAVFVLAGAGTWSLWRLRRAADFEGLRRIRAVCLAWGVIFVGEFLVFVRPFAQGPAHPHLVDYWVARDAFMPLSVPAAVRWIFWCFRSIAADPGAMWLNYPDAALAAMIVGVAVALRRRGKLLLLAAPLPFVLLASALRQYPLGDRLALFLVPQLLLLIAAGIAHLWTNFAARVAAVALAGMILLPSAQRAMEYLQSPPGREETLEIYRWMSEQWRKGDVIYLTHFAAPSFRYYQSQAAWPPDVQRAGAVHIQPTFIEARGILDDVKAFAGQKRVWVMLVHDEGGPLDVHAFTLAGFARIGAPRLKNVETGAAAFLFDCSTAPPPALALP